MDKFKVTATGHGVSYFPMYVAQRQGFFAEQGLEVEWHAPEPWEKVLSDVDTGGYDAVLAGIWNPAIYNQLNISQYRAFCNLCSRVTYACISRVDPGPFDWKWFEGKKILVSTIGGISTYMCLALCLKDHGVDLDKVEFLKDFGFDSLTKFFFHGMGDILFTGYVEALQYVKQGKAYICLDLLEQAGRIPNSVFYAPIEVLEKNRDLYRSFTLGIKKSLLWLQDHNGEDSREMLKAEFPNYDIDVCVKTVDAFRKNHNWVPNVTVDKESNLHYARYQVRFGILKEPLAYEDLVYSDAIEYADNYFKK
jgi:NitT/TauT family transport system substrate-binding protein